MKIKAVKTKGGAVKMDKKFDGDDDWFEGLTASVRNDTDKDILHIGIDVSFLRPEEQAQELPLWYDLEYGADPFRFEPGEEYRTNLPAITPGKTVEIALPPEAYDRIKTYLSELDYSSSHRGIEIRIETIGFSEGTVWRTGTYWQRDATTPRGWKKIEKPEGSARNGTTNLLSFKSAISKLGEPVQMHDGSTGGARARRESRLTTCCLSKQCSLRREESLQRRGRAPRLSERRAAFLSRDECAGRATDFLELEDGR